MSDGTEHAQSGAGTAVGGLTASGVQSGLIVIGAVAAALAVLAFGANCLVIIPGAVAMLAIMAKPELGVYATLMALMLPIPFPVGSAVVYPHDATAVLLIIAAFSAALRAKDFELPPLYYTVPAVAVVAVELLSLANSSNLGPGAVEVVQQFYLLLVAPAAFFLVLRNEIVLNRATKFFMALMIVQVVLVCTQFIGVLAGDESLSMFFAFGRDIFAGGQRVFGTVGPTVGPFIVASVFLWLNSRTRWTWKTLVLLLHVFAIFATGTRTAMFALLVTLVFYGLFANRKGLSLKLLIPILAGGLIFAATMGFGQFLTSLDHRSDRLYRAPIDRKALGEVPEHPIIGHGPKSSADVSISIFGAVKIGVENEYVARIYENGVLGLAALLVFGSVPLLWCVAICRKHQRAGLLAATLAAIIVGIYAIGPAGCIFEGALGQWTAVFYAAMLAATSISIRNAAGLQPVPNTCA